MEQSQIPPLLEPGFTYEEYEQFRTGIELVRIRLLKSSVTSNAWTIDPQNHTLRIGIEDSFNAFDWGFESFQDCTVIVTEDETEAEQATIKVTYGACYAFKFDSVKELDNHAEFIQAFNALHLKLHLYPYVRLFVQDMSSKMDWTPIVLPLAQPFDLTESGETESISREAEAKTPAKERKQRTSKKKSPSKKNSQE